MFLCYACGSEKFCSCTLYSKFGVTGAACIDQRPWSRSRGLLLKLYSFEPRLCYLNLLAVARKRDAAHSHPNVGCSTSSPGVHVRISGSTDPGRVSIRVKARRTLILLSGLCCLMHIHNNLSAITEVCKPPCLYTTPRSCRPQSFMSPGSPCNEEFLCN